MILNKIKYIVYITMGKEARKGQLHFTEVGMKTIPSDSKLRLALINIEIMKIINSGMI